IRMRMREDDFGTGAGGTGREIEGAVQAVVDRLADELEPETRALAQPAGVVDVQAHAAADVETYVNGRSTVADGVRDQLVGDDPELLCGRGIERDRRSLHGHAWRRPRGNRAEKASRVDLRRRLAEQAVHRRDRLDPCRRRLAVATEEE